MMKTKDYIRKLLETSSIGDQVSYRTLMSKSSKGISRRSFNNAMQGLIKEKIITRVSIDSYKIEPIISRTIFVYGSLKNGFVNNKVLEGAVYKGKASTISKYAMFESSVGHFPRLVRTHSIHAKVIHGEIFHISSQSILDSVDRFEGYNYQREHLKVRTSTGIHIVEAYISNNLYAPKSKTKFLSVWKERKVSFNKKAVVRNTIDFLQKKREQLASS